MGKDWYKSKTFWTNVVAIAAIVAQGQFGYVLSPDVQIELLGIVNLGLRAITGEGLNVAGKNLASMIKK